MFTAGAAERFAWHYCAEVRVRPEATHLRNWTMSPQCRHEFCSVIIWVAIAACVCRPPRQPGGVRGQREKRYFFQGWE